jgi:hypothetical protein
VATVHEPAAPFMMERVRARSRGSSGLHGAAAAAAVATMEPTRVGGPRRRWPTCERAGLAGSDADGVRLWLTRGQASRRGRGAAGQFWRG